MDRPKSKENFDKIKEEFDYPIVECFAEGELALREAAKHGLIDYIPGEKDFNVKKDLNEQHDQGSVIPNSDKIGLFNDQLVYQFDFQIHLKVQFSTPYLFHL